MLYDDSADPWGMSEEELKSLGKNPVDFRFMNEEEAEGFFGESALSAALCSP